MKIVKFCSRGVILIFSWIISYYLSFHLLLFLSNSEGLEQTLLFREFKKGYEEIVTLNSGTKLDQTFVKLAILSGKSYIGVTALFTFVSSLWLTPVINSLFLIPFTLKAKNRKKTQLHQLI